MHTAGWLLFVSATVGHAALLTYVMNWIHGVRIHHKLQEVIKWFLAMLIPAGAILFWRVSEFPPESFSFSVAPGMLPTLYTGCCAGMGVLLLGILLTQHLSRRTPAALIRNHNRVVDVSVELGFRPEGRGKSRLLTRIPGNESFLVDLSEKTLTLPRLPAALDGLTILHLSDFHFVGVPGKEYYQQVIDLCAQWEQPDLVAFTGDTVDSDWHHCWIVPVFGRLRWKSAAFAVLGNHDHWYDLAPIHRRFRRIGFRVLGNSWQELTVRGQRMVVIGNEAPWAVPAPDLSCIPADTFRLCLSHTPDNIYWAQKHEIDLVLAGHVHGGQIQLPLVGPVHVPSRYGRRFACGTFEEGTTVMHVSRGLAGQEPLRFNCVPEITRITLRRRDDRGESSDSL